MISNYPFVSCKRYSMMYEKHFIQYRHDVTFLYPTSYMTPVTLKLKLR